ncbi:restriction endonuclease [Actinomycetospora endophytica]|uniref:Restriction endonuclease n=1 Tax=Actinomycetospora endophytica TaxID=2291215 RepID=A0ABS8P9Y9_9PSEU|nr:restriction endonuclease [Actinomycetospora endophytica]MCD2195076.1 restriction endonuclease [Actinomycetospora endophytica]
MHGDVVTEMPTWEGFLRPILTALEDGEPHLARELGDTAADIAGLTAEHRLETLNSGLTRYRDRAGWAMSALARAGAVDRPKRGTYVINKTGRMLLEAFPHGFTEKHLLQQTPGYPIAGGAHGGAGPTPPVAGPGDPLNPREQIAAGVDRLHASVATDLLQRLRSVDPTFFETTVLALLVAMGYGGADEDRARRIGGSGDGGVDGVIDQDPLGLGRIYVQAKRYASDNVVGRPQIQGFVGALHGQQASQGVFITTSSFTKEATEYARQVNASVVLIDGARLANLMIRYGVGVQVENTYTVVGVDEDFFEKA